jgi:phage terminase large subunit
VGATLKIDPAVQMMLDWKADPVYFIESIWGSHKRPEDEFLMDEWQMLAARALVDQDKPISIRSGHGVGKSCWLAWIIIWWMVTKDEPRIPCTAPTGHQLNDVLWGELAKWHKRLPVTLKKELEIKAERVSATRNPREYYAAARTARKEQPEALQGYHSGDLLFVADEASGIDDIIFELGEGSMSTKGARTILTGNPTRTSGYFFDSHNRLRSLWWTHKVSSNDAKMVDPAYAERMGKRYGTESNIYRVRVLGEFPLTDDDSVIPLEYAESAVDRDVDPVTDRVVWGVDVARFGDDESALAKRQGNVQPEKVRSWKGKDLMQTVGIIVNEYNESKKKPDLILVDSIGLGAGVVDRLKEHGIPVRGVNVAESSSTSEKYMRLRDELWWKSREWLQEKNCKLQDDSDLIGELTSPKYSFTSSGKILIESKVDMKKRGVPSPNVADAWNLTFADSGRGGSRWKELDYPNMGYV